MINTYEIYQFKGHEGRIIYNVNDIGAHRHTIIVIYVFDNIYYFMIDGRRYVVELKSYISLHKTVFIYQFLRRQALL